jgi:lysophospholipase L1-like esterase
MKHFHRPPERRGGFLAFGAALLALSVAAAPARAQNTLHAQDQPRGSNPANPTVFYIGDSTVRNGNGTGGNGEWGWGDMTGIYFDSTKVNVVNRALGGRSSRTYLTEGRWDAVRDQLKPGDIVIMQFGHNDGGAINDTSRARGSIRGIGEESQEIDNLLTKKHEVVHSYGWYLRKFIDDTRAKGATPIVASLVPRNIWVNGAVTRNTRDYAGWAHQVAEAEGVAFLDLNELVAREYDKLGEAKVKTFFPHDHTHTNLEGAQLTARVAVAGLEGLPGNPLAPYFSAKARALTPLRP